MGICNCNDWCGGEYVVKASLQETYYHDSIKNSSLKEKDNEQKEDSKKEVFINTKKQIVVILVAGKSLYSNEIVVDDHKEYEVSKFYVVEQMKITAKELKPKAIYKAICDSNKDYKFLHKGFCTFSKGEKSPLYKKIEVLDIDNPLFVLVPNKLYYLFADNYNEMVPQDKEKTPLANTLNIINSSENPKFKKLNSWKKTSRSQRLSGKEDESTPSEFSDNITNIKNRALKRGVVDRSIGISSVEDRKTRCSIINSMYTIKEVDSIHNTSALNITLNTNNLASGPYTMNNSIVNTQNTPTNNSFIKQRSLDKD